MSDGNCAMKIVSNHIKSQLLEPDQDNYLCGIVYYATIFLIIFITQLRILSIFLLF